MKELVTVIILFSIIKITAFSIWNAKQKNITATTGTVILAVAAVFMLATFINDII